MRVKFSQLVVAHTVLEIPSKEHMTIDRFDIWALRVTSSREAHPLQISFLSTQVVILSYTCAAFPVSGRTLEPRCNKTKPFSGALTSSSPRIVKGKNGGPMFGRRHCRPSSVIPIDKWTVTQNVGGDYGQYSSALPTIRI